MTPRYATLRHATPRYATLRQATPHCATLRNATPRYAAPSEFVVVDLAGELSLLLLVTAAVSHVATRSSSFCDWWNWPLKSNCTRECSPQQQKQQQRVRELPVTINQLENSSRTNPTPWKALCCLASHQCSWTATWRSRWRRSTSAAWCASFWTKARSRLAFCRYVLPRIA